MADTSEVEDTTPIQSIYILFVGAVDWTAPCIFLFIWGVQIRSCPWSDLQYQLQMFSKHVSHQIDVFSIRHDGRLGINMPRMIGEGFTVWNILPHQGCEFKCKLVPQSLSLVVECVIGLWCLWLVWRSNPFSKKNRVLPICRWPVFDFGASKVRCCSEGFKKVLLHSPCQKKKHVGASNSTSCLRHEWTWMEDHHQAIRVAETDPPSHHACNNFGACGSLKAALHVQLAHGMSLMIGENGKRSLCHFTSVIFSASVGGKSG